MTPHLLRGDTGQAHRLPSDIPDVAWSELEHDGKLVCASCRHPITSVRQRIEVQGDHEHTFFNPHGHVFHMGCFRQAPGCITDGTPSLEFTWFKGYAWILAGCAQCRHHLGWCFSHGERDRFFALILNRLQEQRLP